MKTENNYQDLTQIKAMDLVDYLADLGYEPAKVRNANYWYHSPLREEKTPSFKVNRNLNRWYDHGIGKGGSIIDFGMHYYQCSIGEFMQKFSSDFTFSKPTILSSKISNVSEAEDNDSQTRLIILKTEPITSRSLIRYLQSRCICLDVASKYCKQVSYQIDEKEYFGLGFANDSGGYEIRNPYFKASSSPKDITTIKNKGQNVCVFEGFFDFLSFATLEKNKPMTTADFVILNSVSFFEKARPELEQYQSIHLYMDRDSAGQKITDHALSISQKYTDESYRYSLCKDLNDWLVNRNAFTRKSFRQRM